MHGKALSSALLSVSLLYSFTALSADSLPSKLRVLLPIYLEQPVAGADGSLWGSEFAVFNSSNTEFLIEWCDGLATPGCILDLRRDERLDPHETKGRLPQRYPAPSTSVPGRVVYFSSPPNDADPTALSFQLRVADTTRAPLSAGTEIPVVRESGFRTSRLNLVNVPVDDNFRLMLRIYEMNLDEADFAVRVYHQATNALLDDRKVTARTGRHQEALRFEAGYVALSDIADVPSGEKLPTRIRIEVEPENPGSFFWAFVSVTNDTTQQFTLVTPQ